MLCRNPVNFVPSNPAWKPKRTRTSDPRTSIDPGLATYRGLEKLEEIFLESPPELDSEQLMNILNNKDSKASRLRKLDLRFCEVDLQTISSLLGQEMNTLTHLTLLLGYRYYMDHYDKRREPPPHLCPLVRQFSKNLVYLKYAARHVCRELFFADDEISALTQSGLVTNTDYEEAPEDDLISKAHIWQLIPQHRVRKSRAMRNRQVDEAIALAKADNSHLDVSTVKCNTELRLDREEEARKRTIKDSTMPWKRSMIAWKGVCPGNGSWAHLQAGASMEEEGIEVTLTSILISLVLSRDEAGILTINQVGCWRCQAGIRPGRVISWWIKERNWRKGSSPISYPMPCSKGLGINIDISFFGVAP